MDRGDGLAKGWVTQLAGVRCRWASARRSDARVRCAGLEPGSGLRKARRWLYRFVLIRLRPAARLDDSVDGERSEQRAEAIGLADFYKSGFATPFGNQSLKFIARL